VLLGQRWQSLSYHLKTFKEVKSVGEMVRFFQRCRDCQGRMCAVWTFVDETELHMGKGGKWL
jgi:hypothetical protein